MGRTLDLIVVDGCYPERFSDWRRTSSRATARRHPSTWAIGAALSEHRRAQRHAEQVDWLRRHAEAPVVTLPFLFMPELAPRDLEQLARELAQTVAR